MSTPGEKISQLPAGTVLSGGELIPESIGLNTYKTTPAALALYTLSNVGAVSGGGTTNFLRADGAWASPAGSGNVTSVGIASTDLAISNSPITTSGNVTLNINNNAVTNAKLAQMAAGTLKANITGSLANSTDATLASVAAVLPGFYTSLNAKIDFGAKGDYNGSTGTDDTVALQNWINALATNTSTTHASPIGFLPAGAYKITSPLTIPADLTHECAVICGVGYMRGSVITPIGCRAFTIDYGDPQSVAALQVSNGLVMRDIDIDAVQAVDPVACIYVRSVYGLVLENVRIISKTNTCPYGISFIWCNNIILRNPIIFGSAGSTPQSGINLVRTGIRIYGCDIESNGGSPGYGINISGQSQVDLFGPYFEACTRTINHNVCGASTAAAATLKVSDGKTDGNVGNIATVSAITAATIGAGTLLSNAGLVPTSIYVIGPAVVFTASVGGATSGTLSAAITNGTYRFIFPNSNERTVTVTGTTAAAWTGALTAGTVLSATCYELPTNTTGTYTITDAAQAFSSGAGAVCGVGFSGRTNVYGGSTVAGVGATECFYINSDNFSSYGHDFMSGGINVAKTGLKNIVVDSYVSDRNQSVFIAGSDMSGVRNYGRATADLANNSVDNYKQVVNSGTPNNLFNIVNGSGTFKLKLSLNVSGNLDPSSYEFTFSINNGATPGLTIGNIYPITFGSINAAAACTLSGGGPYGTGYLQPGSYYFLFSNGDVRWVTIGANGVAATWTGNTTAGALTAATVTIHNAAYDSGNYSPRAIMTLTGTAGPPTSTMVAVNTINNPVGAYAHCNVIAVLEPLVYDGYNSNLSIIRQ